MYELYSIFHICTLDTLQCIYKRKDQKSTKGYATSLGYSLLTFLMRHSSLIINFLLLLFNTNEKLSSLKHCSELIVWSLRHFAPGSSCLMGAFEH